MVTWDKSDDATGYYISCTNTGHGDKKEPVDGGDTTNYTLSELEENTPYNITVQALNINGIKGDQSDVASIRTGKWCITIILT